MNSHLARAVAGLSIVGLAVWLRLDRGGDGDLGETARSRVDTLALETGATGSAVPCAVPLGWRVGAVDEGFGIDREGVRVAVAAAAEVWEDAVGRTLFPHDPAAGFPVRLVYDDRQARSRLRGVREEELEELGARLGQRRQELVERGQRYRDTWERYEKELADFRERLALHNDTVRAWNSRGGAPGGLAAELRAREDDLELERLDLSHRREELEDVRRELEADQEAFTDLAESADRRARALEEAFPPEPVESGMYREAVRTEGGRIVSVDREIRVYRFEGSDDLQRIVTHELGHALGLGHTGVAGAVMSQEYTRSREGVEGSAIHAADLELLESRCPEL